MSEASNHPSMSDSTKLKIVAMICGTVLFIATFIWPTPYRYERYRGWSLLRTTRLTGDTNLSFPNNRPTDLQE